MSSKIPACKAVIADECYGGVREPDKVSTRNELDSDKVEAFKKRDEARKEIVNSKVNTFGILIGVF